MVLDPLDGDSELVGDELVRRAVGDEPQYHLFARTEPDGQQAWLIVHPAE
ncbi:MAG: hypothetical protein ABSF89_16705 [Acidimicrobiales bacterium]